MRYVKLPNMQPGERFDLLTLEPVYSSRFLSEEEHGTPRWKSVWSFLWCLPIGVIPFLRGHLTIRWMELTALEFFLVLCGIFLVVLVVLVEATS